MRAHDFGRFPADELARRIGASGFECVQLAVNKAIAGPEIMPGDLHPGLAAMITRAFFSRHLEVAVLGCYINPIHPDRPHRELLLNSFKEHLRFARDLGTGVVALESGSVNADYSPGTGNDGEPAFQSLLASLADLVAAGEACGVRVGLEPVVGHVVSSPRKMRRVLNAIASKNLQVIFDPVNLLSAENFRDAPRLVDEALELWGDRIAAVHAKDFRTEGGPLVPIPVGRGEFCHAHLLKGLAAGPRPITLLLEGTTEADAPRAREFLARTGAVAGLRSGFPLPPGTGDHRRCAP